MESVIARVKRLFPYAVVSEGLGKIQVAHCGHVCWIDTDDLWSLDDLDTTYLVAALLKGVTP